MRGLPDGSPKQFLEINGKPILIHTLQLFQYHDQIDAIYISVLKDYIPYVEDLANEYHLTKVKHVLAGGATSQDSIYNALKMAESECPEDSIVLIHDGVRPYVSYDVIANNIATVKKYGNAITSTACYETIMISEDGIEIDSVPPRKDTYSAQAPQSFYLKDIIAAHDVVRATTTPEDVYMFRALLQYKENEQAFGLGITNKIDTRMSQYKKDNEK